MNCRRIAAIPVADIEERSVQQRLKRREADSETANLFVSASLVAQAAVRPLRDVRTVRKAATSNRTALAAKVI
jgi:hypothetical protein